MKPIIGVTSFINKESKLISVNFDYANAVAAAGGLPVVFPIKPELAEEYLAMVDGVLFTGGGDVEGKYFNQENHEKISGISEARDSFEITLAKAAKAAGKPVMGICRGEQVLNIAAGGDIKQHVEGHSQKDERSVATHEIKLLEGTKLRQWLGSETVKVNSFHHQIVDRLAPGFAVSARSLDGFTEAWENTGDWFCFGVQWHPEALLASPENIVMLELFKRFVAACAK